MDTQIEARLRQLQRQKRLIECELKALTGVRGTSGIKGVTKHPGGRWRATIHQDGKAYHLGLFKTKEEAAEAYKAASGAGHETR
jgi:hypothetical protein